MPAPLGGPGGSPGRVPPSPGAPTGPFVRVPGPVGAICQGGPATGRFIGRNLFGKGATEPTNELISIPHNPDSQRSLAVGKGPEGLGRGRGGLGGSGWVRGAIFEVSSLSPHFQLLPKIGGTPGERGSPNPED